MNSTARTATTTVPHASARARSGGLYQRLTLRALAQMPAGQLHLELSDGTVHRLGGKQNVQWHATTLAAAALAIPQVAAVKVRRSVFFEKCVLYGDIGFAEAFIDGDWETPDLAAVIAWFVLNVDRSPSLSGSRAKAFGVNLLRVANRLNHLFRPNSRRTAARNIHEHYDLSNDFFRLWLDPSMMYSCARWERPEFTLEQAQRAKNDALCCKLRLTAADHVLEIGTGWGGWSLHAAKNYGCRVTSLTISQEQYDLPASGSLPPVWPTGSKSACKTTVIFLRARSSINSFRSKCWRPLATVTSKTGAASLPGR
jgi:cyclopropane-fatty-acyl-phospholipid synthase